MRYTWIDDYLMRKRGVTRDLQADWNWVRYQIGGKMFAAICLDGENKPYYINLKLDPAEGAFWRSQYEDVVPGFYSNKLHWNSIKPDGAVPDDLLKDMLDKSRQLVLESFSKKKQREILGMSCCGTQCSLCSYYGNLCQGCNEANGKVFHAPANKPCAIYQCCVQKNKRATCAACDALPCQIWQDTKDPGLSDEAFAATIRERVNLLKDRQDL